MMGADLPQDAGFVGAVTQRRNDEGDPALYFRREFAVDDGLVAARLFVTALGVVEPWVNGAKVGDAVLEPGWTSYAHRLLVREHDIAGMLSPGANVVGAIVGEGWAAGKLGYESIARRNRYTDRLALFAVVELDYGDRVERIVGDDRWLVADGGVRANSIYDGETFDARLEPSGWAAPGFDDAGWTGVEPVEWDLSTLERATVPPIRRTEELAPVEIFTTDSGSTVVDFGQNIAGWVRLQLEGPAGTEVTVRHAEVLVDGVPDYATLRVAEATDTFVLAGDGVEEFEPRFTFHGFRYAELDGLPSELDTNRIRATVVHSDMDRTGWFECSDERLNRLHQNVVWSMRGNFVGIPTDCPQRDERLGWTGDLNAFASTATFLYDVREVVESWLADLRHEQQERGFVPYVVPDVQGHTDQPAALWSDAAVSVPWQLYQRYGDVGVLERSYDSMVMFVRQVEARLDPSGTWTKGFQLGDWLDPDAPDHNPTRGKTDTDLVATAYFAKVCREMAATAEILGNEADERAFTVLAERVRHGFRATYTTTTGRVAQESATAYALAICFDLLDEDQLPTAGERLARVVRRNDHRISTGFAGTPLVAHALSRTGHLDAAYRLLLQTEMPSFLYPVLAGATTIWERWDSVRPDGTLNPSGMTSLNHYALGAIADWMHTVIGGLQPTSPGHATMRIAPQPGGGLTHARTALDTVHGRASVHWKVDDDLVDVEVEVPEGCTATVVLPLHPEGEQVEVTGGRHHWAYRGRGVPPVALRSPVEDIIAEPELWDEVVTLLHRQLSETSREGFDRMLRLVLLASPHDPFEEAVNRFPSTPPEVQREIAELVRRWAGGVSP